MARDSSICKLIQAVAWLVVALAPEPFSQAEVNAPASTKITSSGLGTIVPLPDPNRIIFDITGGTRRHGNLFHSFGVFTVREGDTANFVNTKGPGIVNIISRVTGSDTEPRQTSKIYGIIKTTGFDQANLFLLNPSGIMFGPNASLDVKGSFHVSTADYLQFANGKRFYADLNNKNSVLSSAPVSAFGFSGYPLGFPPKIQSAGTLEVDPGNTLSLIGGDVEIAGSLVASGNGAGVPGQIRIVSVTSEAQVPVSGDFQDFDSKFFSGSARSNTRLGRIEIKPEASIQVSGDPGGTVFIRGGQLIGNGSCTAGPCIPSAPSILVANATTQLGIDVKVTGDVSLDNGMWIVGIATGNDPAANVQLGARNITLAQGSKVQSGSILLGPGGGVQLNTVDSINVLSGSSISTQAGTADVGRIEIYAKNLTVNDGVISSSTQGPGNAGDIMLRLAGNLILTNGGKIVTGTLAGTSGKGGKLTVKADESVSISGRSTNDPTDEFPDLVIPSQSSGLFSTTSGTGLGGEIQVTTPRLQITNGGVISTQSIEGATGTAGNINLSVGSLRMSDGHITATAGTTAEATADNTAGGNITINPLASSIHLTDSEITTSVQGSGAGGNIIIGSAANPFASVVLNNSGIHANAVDSAGGNINIFSNVFLSSLPLASAVTATSALSTPGIIDIQASITDISGGLTQLPQVPLHATELLRASCAARFAEGKSSSLVLSGRDGLPLEPGQFPRPLYVGALAGASNMAPPSFAGENLDTTRLALVKPVSGHVQLGMGWDKFRLTGFGC